MAKYYNAKIQGRYGLKTNSYGSMTRKTKAPSGAKTRNALRKTARKGNIARGKPSTQPSMLRKQATRVAKRPSRAVAGGMGAVIGAGIIGGMAIHNAAKKLGNSWGKTHQSIGRSNKLHNQWLRQRQAQRKKKS